MAALTVVPIHDLSLFAINEELNSLLDTEALVSPEQEAEYSATLESWLLARDEKTDAVGHWLAQQESQILLAAAEIKRLQDRKRELESAVERTESHVARVIESLGRDAKGKRKPLEGLTLTLLLRGCEKRVEVTDADAVPSKYKRAEIVLPYDTWDKLLDAVDLDLRAEVMDAVKSPKIEVSTSLVKADLKANVSVPGAELAGGTYLVRK